MIKLICHFKAKAGMSQEAFQEYYEGHHVPLILKMLPLMVDYRRSYLKPGGRFSPAHVVNGPAAPEFDVVTECWYKNQEEFDAMLARTEDPAVGNAIAADEEKFMDRNAMVMFLVDECRTSAEDQSRARVAAGASPL